MSYREYLKYLLTAVFLIVVLLGLWHLRFILMLGFTAAMLAVALSVPACWLQERGLRRGIANIIAVVGFITTTILLGFVIFPTVIEEATNLFATLPTALVRVTEAYETWRTSNENLIAILPALNYSEVSATLVDLGIQPGDVSNIVLPVVNSTLPVLQGVGSVVFGLIANLAIVIFVSIFFLAEPATYTKAALMLVPHTHQKRALEIVDALYSTLTNWVTAQFISISITVFLVWFILGVLLGMSHSLTVALFAGVATFVPNLGSLLPLIPITIFTAADDPTKLLVIVPAYLIIQLLESNVLTPYIVKVELDIPAGGLLLFQVVAATVLGALGILLAIPLLALVITLVREIYSYDMLRLNQQGLTFFVDRTGGLRIDETDHLDKVAMLEDGRSASQSPPADDALPANR